MRWIWIDRFLEFHAAVGSGGEDAELAEDYSPITFQDTPSCPALIQHAW